MLVNTHIWIKSFGRTFNFGAPVCVKNNADFDAFNWFWLSTVEGYSVCKKSTRPTGQESLWEQSSSFCILTGLRVRRSLVHSGWWIFVWGRGVGRWRRLKPITQSFTECPFARTGLQDPGDSFVSAPLRSLHALEDITLASCTWPRRLEHSCSCDNWLQCLVPPL